MKHIVEHFGLGALQLAAWGICIGIALAAAGSGGGLHLMICAYVQGMCG